MAWLQWVLVVAAVVVVGAAFLFYRSTPSVQPSPVSVASSTLTTATGSTTAWTEKHSERGELRCSTSSSQVDKNILALYAAQDPAGYTTQHGWDITGSASPPDAPFVNYRGTRELGICANNDEIKIDSSIELADFCGTPYRTKHVAILGIDVVDRIAQLTTENKKAIEDPPRYWSPINICNSIQKEYAANAVLDIHVFPPGIWGEGIERAYALYIGSLVFGVSTSTNSIVESAPATYYIEHPEDDDPFGATFTTGRLRDQIH